MVGRVFRRGFANEVAREINRRDFAAAGTKIYAEKKAEIENANQKDEPELKRRVEEDKRIQQEAIQKEAQTRKEGQS